MGFGRSGGRGRANYLDSESIRRIPQQFRRTFKIGEMHEKHHEIARRIALGHKNKEIAEDLGVSQVMVSYTKNSPIVEQQVGIMRGAMNADTVDLGIRIQQLGPKALDMLEEVLEKGTVNGKDVASHNMIKVAENHLDRAGYAPVKKVAVATGKLTPDDINRIKERALNAGIIDMAVEA